MKCVLQAAPVTPAQLKAVQDLLGAMQVENVLRGVAARSRYPSAAQREAVLAKVNTVPPAEVVQRLAAPLSRRARSSRLRSRRSSMKLSTCCS